MYGALHTARLMRCTSLTFAPASLCARVCVYAADEKGAYCAVGLYNTTGIEIWNLDLINNVVPEAPLDFAAPPADTAADAAHSMTDAKGSSGAAKKKKKKAKAAAAAAAAGPKNAVLGLAWSPANRYVSASPRAAVRCERSMRARVCNGE